MNPYTRTLLEQLDDRALVAFVHEWDALEAVIIRIYKRGEAVAEDTAEHEQARRKLEGLYPRWKAELARFWRATRIGGQPVLDDPFERLMAIASSEEFVNNWAALQTLPAAREALNAYLTACIKLDERGRS